jgi:hypothetical protein
MSHDKDGSDRNAHERGPADASRTNAAATDQERKARETKDDKENPMSRLRFGSAGSGGAEREPGPERP